MINLPVFSPISTITLPEFGACQIDIKRDDLIDPLISGNKWRKLKYTLLDARKKNKNHLVSFGGAYSNHLLALASASAKFGFEATAFVRGEEIQNPMLQMCQLFGMKLLFTDRQAYKDKDALFMQRFATDTNAYFINEGGESVQGIQGCEEIIQEITQDYQHIFCASGTGTTAQGLLKGIQKYNSNAILHVIPVLKNAEEINEKLSYIASSGFQIHDNYHFGGYAKTPPELIAFVKAFVAHTGIIIEPVYTGKVFFAVQDLLKNNLLNPKQKTLVLHTGGMMGLFGKLNAF